MNTLLLIGLLTARDVKNTLAQGYFLFENKTLLFCVHVEDKEYCRKLTKDTVKGRGLKDV